MIGVYWGAFDPPTIAHRAIICAALKDIPLKKIVVVVNNHKYKNYTHSLAVRMDLIRQMQKASNVVDVELLSQDEKQKIDYKALRSLFQEPLCAIAGYDSYVAWMGHSTSLERSLYSAIAVVPRGDEVPVLVDPNAFLLHIEEDYKHVSSSKVRGC